MEGLLGRLSALIPGSAGMSDEDKRALITQGLLSAGLGILANNKGHGGHAGPAIGAGLLGGMGAINDGTKQLADNKYKQQVMAMQSADPAGFRTLDMMARAAGYEPNTQGYKDFFRRNNGEIARESSAAIQYKEVVGPDGRTRMVAFDPRDVGAQVVGGGEAYGSGVGGYTIDPSLPPQVQDAIRQSEQSGQPMPPHIDLAPAIPRPSPTAGVNPFVSRSPEEQAAATTAAQEAAKLQYLPQELGLRTGAAIDQAGGTTAASEAAKTTAEAQRNLPKAIQQAEISLDTIKKLEGHPGLEVITGVSGVIDPRNYWRGTEAQGAQALADQIQGQTFLQAYQTLKGGGQITEVEGKKAEAALARLNTKQSAEDYRAALGDLRQVIQTGLQKAKEQAGATQSATPSRIRYDAQGNRIP